MARIVFILFGFFSLSVSASTTLFIGDSLSSGTAFGRIMVDFFRSPQSFCSSGELENSAVFSYARPSAASRHWLARSGRDKHWLCRQSRIYVNGTQAADISGAQLCAGSGANSAFEKLLTEHRPSAVMIALGGNSLAFSESFIRAKINALLDQLPDGIRCYWVTPPLVSQKYLAQVRRIERLTAAVLDQRPDKACRLFATLDQLTGQTVCDRFNTADGLHHTRCGSTLWAKTVIENLCRHEEAPRGYRR